MCEKQSNYLKAMGHPDRLRIIKILLSHGSVSVSNLQKELKIHQSSISQHLNKMKQYGIVQSKRESNFIFYSLQDKTVTESIIKTLDYLED